MLFPKQVPPVGEHLAMGNLGNGIQLGMEELGQPGCDRRPLLKAGMDVDPLENGGPVGLVPPLDLLKFLVECLQGAQISRINMFLTVSYDTCIHMMADCF